MNDLSDDQKQIVTDFVHLAGRLRVTEVVKFTQEVLESDHPTNQQSFWRFVQDLANEYAKYPENCDDRNRGSKKFTEKISELQIHLPYI